jgi:condensin complex subunit 1
LLDKTIRIEIENPIFHRLQEAVEQLTRSRDWFGLAEHAINTPYALGDHPDVLCNTLIKNLTVHACTPRPKEQAEEGEGEKDTDTMDEDRLGDVSRGSEDSGAAPKAAVSNDVGDKFELSPCKQF